MRGTVLFSLLAAFLVPAFSPAATPSPTPSPSPGFRGRGMSPRRLPPERKAVERIEVIVEEPGQPPEKSYVYPERDYKPEHKSLGYGLLSEGYRQMYYQAFGVYPITPPTPLPTATPVPTATPGTEPTPTAKTASASGGSVRAAAAAGSSWEEEITVVSPSGEVTRTYAYPEREYKPSKKSLNYSLLAEAYRNFYHQAFGKWPPTPTPPPPPTPSPTPEGYKTPEAPPTATPTATPDYCGDRQPLRLRWVDSATSLNPTRSTLNRGWAFLLQTADGRDTLGGLYDRENAWREVEFFNEDRPVLLRVVRVDAPSVAVEKGDALSLRYVDSQGSPREQEIVLPAITGSLPAGATYYLGSDGMLYRDIQLCFPALITPTPTPEGYLSPTPSPTRTPEGYRTPSPTPSPTPDYCAGNQPLRVYYIQNLWIAQTRSAQELGWQYVFSSAGDDGVPAGAVYDNQNAFIPAPQPLDSAPVKLNVQGTGITILAGDRLRVEYKEIETGPLLALEVLLPPDGGSGAFGPYYVADDGSIYSDPSLCSIVCGTPTVTPTGSPTPTPVPGATPLITPPSPTPEPSAVPTASPGELRVADPTPDGGVLSLPSPTPEPFQLLAVLEGGEGWMDGVWSDGSLILGANEDGAVYAWEREDFRRRGRLSFPNAGALVAVGADSRNIYGASEDGNLYVWRRGSFARVRTLRGDTSIGDPVEAVLAFDGVVYAGTTGRRIYSWDADDLQAHDEIRVSTGWVTGLGADAGRLYGATGGAEFSLYVWDRDSLALLAELTGAESDLNGVWIDSERICLPSSDGNVYVWTSNLEPVKILRDCPAQVTGAAATRGFLYAACHDGSLYVWELPNLRLARRIDDAPAPLQGLAVAGDVVLGACRDGNVYCWYAPDGTRLSAYGATPTPTPFWRPRWVPPPTPVSSAPPRPAAAAATPPAVVVDLDRQGTPVPYDPEHKSLDYGLLQETYKETAYQWFGIVLTTPTPAPSPTPPPTPIPTPTSTGGGGSKVAINEINWAGLSGDPDGFWLELYNYGDEAASLGSWTLEYDEGAVTWKVSLSSYSLGAGKYYVAANSTCPSNSKIYGSIEFSTGDGVLILRDAGGSQMDKVDMDSLGPKGGLAISMERQDPSSGSSTASNWNSAPATATYSCVSLNYGTPGAANSSATSRAAVRTAFIPSLGLEEYADWIDFITGNYFKTFEGDLATADPRYSLYDYLPNTAFVYLVAGYTPSADYFRKNLLELVEDSSFDWGGSRTCRGIADIAEAYLAMASSGVFSSSERELIEERLVELALKNREFTGTTNYSQGSICGLNAVVGYIVGGEQGAEMIEWASRLLSYDDTWTLPENSRYWQGLFNREMLRVALYSNRMGIPSAAEAGRPWRENFARQVEWIISNFPPNGFMPAWGEDYRQSFTDRFLEILAVATSILDDGDPEHVALAREAKWLLQQCFDYARTHRVGYYGSNAYGYPGAQMGPYAVFCNPVYLYWFLNEGLLPSVPDPERVTGGVRERPMMPDGSLKGVYDESLEKLEAMPDKIVHRDGAGADALFFLLDLGAPAAGSTPNRYGFGNDVLSLGVGSEEFVTGVTMNYANPSYLLHNLCDIPSDYASARVREWSDNDEYSRSRTSLKAREGAWVREVTLHKTGDRRIEVSDTLPGRGTVRWHLQGDYSWLEDGMVLDVNGTLLEVTWRGEDHAGHRTSATWGEAIPENRWTKAGGEDQEIELTRLSAGTVTTVFRPLDGQDRALVPESPYVE